MVQYGRVCELGYEALEKMGTNMDQLAWLKEPRSNHELGACASFDLCMFYIVICFVFSLISDNYSQVDKLWSIVPWGYVVVFFYFSNGSARVLLMAMVTILWGVRLTLNFNRRGGYTFPPWEGEEDYRWAIVRKVFGSERRPILWQIFNILFICIYQHVLLMLLAFPAYCAVRFESTTGNMLKDEEVIPAALIVFLVALEGVADDEQFKFQTEKYRLIESGIPKDELKGRFKAGFIQTGLWSLCRHPNYACEQLIWITLAAWAVYLERENALIGVLGAVNLVFLFGFSSLLSEWITANKYPAYKDYQRTHCRFLPLGKVSN